MIVNGIKINNILSLFLISLLVLISLLGFLSVKHMNNSHSHSEHFLADCPYVEEGSYVCPFNLFNNLNVVKNISNSVLNIYLFFILISLFFYFKQSLLNKKIINLLLYKKRFIFLEIKILYQELFTKGLLNPKLF